MYVLLLVFASLLTLWFIASPFVVFTLLGRVNRLQARIFELENAIANLGRMLRGSGADLAGRAAPPPSPEVPSSRSDDEPQRMAEPTPQKSTPRPSVAAAGMETTPDDNASADNGRGDGVAVPAEAGDTAGSRWGGLEEALGARWAVYAGGLALALGSVFLVHYSIEAGLLGPRVRLLLGLALSAALIGLGEWFRRSDRKLGIGAAYNAHIPSILTAAGTIAAFATVYAAHGIFGFIGALTAFLALGLIGIGTMFAAALHGPWLAGLGLAGSYITPVLVTSKSSNPWALVVFLGVVAASALVLARVRVWLWLAATAVAGAVIWGLLIVTKASWSSQALEAMQWTDASYIHAGLQLLLAGVIVAVLPHLSPRDKPIAPDWVAHACLGALVGLAVVSLASISAFDTRWLLFAFSFIGVLCAVAYMSVPAAGACALAGVVAAGVALFWPAAGGAGPLPYLDPWLGGVLRRPDPTNSYLAVLLLGVAPAFGVGVWRLYHQHWFSVKTAGLYALGATALPLIVLAFAYMRVSQFESSVMFTGIGVIAAVSFWALGELFLRRERFVETLPGSAAADDDKATPDALRAVELPAARVATGAFTCAGIAALCFAIAVFVDRSLLTAALAVTALGIAWVSTTRDVPILRHAVWGIGTLVTLRFLIAPWQLMENVGTTPIFNWLLVIYGIPALAFYFAGRVLRYERDRPDLATNICDGLAMFFLALLVFFEVRHFVYGGRTLAVDFNHVEAGLHAFSALALSQIALRQSAILKGPVYTFASRLFAWLGIAYCALGLGIGVNPYLTGETVVGPPVISSLLVAYLLPGIAALYVARVSYGLGISRLSGACAVTGILLVFLFVTYETRHVFQGASIWHRHSTSGMEMWAYTAVWLALGIGFLAYGFWREMTMPRVASAVLIVAACLKVVFVDLSGVSGLWRAASFICLGAVLIGIGLFYQRVVFARPVQDSSAQP